MNELVFMSAGHAVTTTLAIAEGTNNEHASVISLVRKYQTDLEEFGLVDFKSESTGGRPTEYAILSELQSTLLLTYLRNSDVVRAFKKRLVKKFWEMTEQLRGTESQRFGSRPSAKLEAEMAGAELYARLLRPAPSSQVAMIAKIVESNGGDPKFLPAYAIDAAPETIGGSSMPTKPLKELLADHGIRMSPQAFNKLLMASGYLEERTRPSSTSQTGVKSFKAITEEGLRFGKNVTSRENPREVQPHWYVERFVELYDLVANTATS
jgi:phage regulator Rha-like protein